MKLFQQVFRKFFNSKADNQNRSNIVFLLCVFLLFVSFNYTKAQTQDTIVYDQASPFFGGFARVVKDSTTFYIDTKGNKAFDAIVRGTKTNNVSIFTNETDTIENKGLPEHYVIVSKDDKGGILTEFGEWLLQPEYDLFDTRFKSFWEVTKNGKKSHYTKDGFKLPFKYDEVEYLDGRYFDVKQGEFWGVYDSESKKLVVPLEYNEFDYCGGCESKSDYVYAKKNGKWGIVTFENEVLIPFEYGHHHGNMRSDEWVKSFTKNDTLVHVNINTKKVYKIGTDTELLINGFTAKKKNGKFGLLNAYGKLILDHEYDDINYDDDFNSYDLPENLIRVKKDDKFGVKDTLGNTILKTIYDGLIVREYDRTLLRTDKDGKDLVFDLQGKNVTPSGADEVEEFKLNSGDTIVTLLKFKKGNRFGIYNQYTKTKIESDYTDLSSYKSYNKKYIIRAEKDEKVGLIDTQGKLLVPITYDDIDNRSYKDLDLVPVENQRKRGYYNIVENREILPTAYDYAKLISTETETYIQIVKENLEGIATLDGNVVCEVEYSRIEAINGSFLLRVKYVKTENNTESIYSIFNLKTQEATKLPYNYVKTVEGEDILIVSEGDKDKLYDVSEHKIIEAEYSTNGFPDKIEGFNNGVARTLKKVEDSQYYKYGFINTKGQLVVAIVYDDNSDAYKDNYFIGENYLMLLKDSGAGYLKIGITNRKGEILIEPKYEKVLPEVSGKGFLVKNVNKYGVADPKGKFILPVEYDDIAVSQNNMRISPQVNYSFPLLLNKDGQWRYVLADGSVLPIQVEAFTTFIESAY